MTYAETILPEFDEEMANARRVLELVPDDKLDWKAGPKTKSIGWNANHLAEIPDWVEVSLTQPAWDFAPVDGPRYQSPKLSSRQEILDLFDKNVATPRKAIAEVTDEEMAKSWSLLQAGHVFLTMPRTAVMRGFILSHTIHHRAHLLVYLRLNEIPVPGMYGPSE